MDLKEYKKMFVHAKDWMTLDEAVGYIRRILIAECPMLPKRGHWNRREYDQRVAQRVVCEELIRTLQSAPPWKDYREIIAELEWPYMRRVATHCLSDIYDGRYGKERGEADVWFLDMWMAYHAVFCRMPGASPGTSKWRMYDILVDNANQKLSKYRRNW